MGLPFAVISGQATTLIDCFVFPSSSMVVSRHPSDPPANNNNTSALWGEAIAVAEQKGGFSYIITMRGIMVISTFNASPSTPRATHHHWGNGLGNRPALMQISG